MLVHTVFFYLKPEVSVDEKSAFIKEVETLGAIDTVQAIYVGTPAATPVRPVIQTDYTVALTVILNNLEDQDVYQDHQIHHDFIAKNSHLWEKVAVFDAD